MLGTEIVRVSSLADTGSAELNVICQTTSVTFSWIAAAQASHRTVASAIFLPPFRFSTGVESLVEQLPERGKRPLEVYSALSVGVAT